MAVIKSRTQQILKCRDNATINDKRSLVLAAYVVCSVPAFALRLIQASKHEGYLDLAVARSMGQTQTWPGPEACLRRPKYLIYGADGCDSNNRSLKHARSIVQYDIPLLFISSWSDSLLPRCYHCLARASVTEEQSIGELVQPWHVGEQRNQEYLKSMG